MSQANHASTTARDCAASPSEINSIPTSAELASMYDALPGRPELTELTDMVAWIAEGVEAAAETRAYERRRAAFAKAIYGDVEEAA
jgi:hypothetical protein